jgi:hypothetical protein
LHAHSHQKLFLVQAIHAGGAAGIPGTPASIHQHQHNITGPAAGDCFLLLMLSPALCPGRWLAQGLKIQKEEGTARVRNVYEVFRKGLPENDMIRDLKL